MKHTKQYSRTGVVRKISLNHFLTLAFISIALTARANPMPPVEPGVVSEMIIEDIVCEGNDNTDCDFITKKYYQRVGDHVDPEEIADARYRLGTLIQFRNISVRLEKGSQRGYVIVVFQVLEASQIQYGFTASYFKSEASYANRIWEGPAFSSSDGSTLGTSFSVTDFNFLGSGKRLGLIISADSSESNSLEATTSTYFYSDDSSFYTDTHLRSVDQEYEGLNVGIEYYDPHLNGTSRYYLYGSIGFSYGNGDIAANNWHRDPYGNEYWRYPEIHDPDLTKKFAELEFGRRIGRWSYISFKTGYTNKKYMDGSPVNDLEQINYTYGSLNYGWNTENDSIFPTKGSAFNFSVTGDNFNSKNFSGIFETGDYYFGADYRKHFNPFNRNVVTLGAATQYDPDISEITTSLFTRYTLINSFDSRNGRYSGLHIQLGAYRIEDMIEEPDGNTGYSVSLGYTHQTEKMIVKLQAGYSSLERSGL